MQSTTFSTGKVIIVGEHAVVHGFPAVVASISLPLQATLSQTSQPNHDLPPFVQNLFDIASEYWQIDASHFSVHFKSDIPIGCCLGSSAASASAVFQSFATYCNKPLSKKELLDLVMKSETFAHGRPSGIDPVAVVEKGVLHFQKKIDGLWYEHIETSAFKNKKIFFVQSGKPSETTKDMIDFVWEKIEKPGTKILLEKIGTVSEQFVAELKKNRFSTQLITENQRLLEELGVVSPRAQDIIQAIETYGGVAKITGGGGRSTGSGMIFAYHTDSDKFENFLQSQNWEYLVVQLGVL